MKLIIDIPEEMYKDIKSGKDGYSNYVHTAIRNGTPLSTDAVDRVTIREYLYSMGMGIKVTTTDDVLDKIRAEVKDASLGEWYVGRTDGKDEEVVLLKEALEIIDKYKAEGGEE